MTYRPQGRPGPEGQRGPQFEIASSLPPVFLQRLRSIVGDPHANDVIESFALPKKTAFRVNTLVTDPQDLIGELSQLGVLAQPVPWCDHAFWVEPEQREAVTHSAAASDGRIYVQGLSSILATLVLDPQPGEWNLDLAAAPGGKSTHIVALMQNAGKLSVVEPIRKRMYRLADNLKRLGSTISKTYLMDGRKAGHKVPERFDRVMLDAPCSSESRMRADDPKSYEFWSVRKIREQSRKQRGLIESAFTTLKRGGTMLYCTCSFAPEENEFIVSGLREATNGAAEVLPIDLPFDHWQPGLTQFGDLDFHSAVSETRRILPNEFFDGFYLARIGKRA